MLLKKPVLIIVLTIAAMVTGFIFLLKGCLAKYDERFIKTPALVFEKKGKNVVFSIVEFQKTTSYSQKGNFVRKSVRTMYYVQINDGETAELVAKKKIKTHKEVKNYPVEMLGASGNTAWAFIGEPMAFDAFTLDTKADIKILEEKNPSLRGKFPAERQFYSFNITDKNIYFTAKDGSKWQLNTQTLQASPSVYQKGESLLKNKMTLLEQELKNNQINLDSLYQQKNYRPSRDYSAKKITYTEYQQINNRYYKERDSLYKVRDSLQQLERQYRDNKSKIEDLERDIEQLQRTSLSFSQIKTNQDTLQRKWFGLYSDEELDKLNDRINNQNIYDETARRKFFISDYSFSKNNDALINKAAVKSSSTTDFLDAGFLLNKTTARPIITSGNQFFLIVHKDQVGRDGKILITSITTEGKSGWTYNTALTEWSDWILSGNHLYVFGVDNKNLSSGETNILLCIDLIKGKASKYDYFKEKKLE